ncbi:MAG: sulfurtransferase, partial [Saprospiraceae bacterium]|nr:sulfurtransferase [Saprospiraceae bacterium]
MSVLLCPAALLPLRQQSNLVLIDARTGPAARQQFEIQHLEGARFVDLETELAHKKSDPADGGRHPLPDVAAFCQLLGRLGIGPDTQVVVYDDKQGANAAARFWWMLSALGHPQVQVLDGGYQAAVEAGFPLRAGAEADAGAAPYPASEWLWPTVGIETVERAVQDPGVLVIDVRDADRFAGKVEPIDLVAGHIPGAVNVPFSENLDAAGFFHSP